MTSLSDVDKTRGHDGQDWRESTGAARRICVDKFTPAERAIYDAMVAVEALPPDVRLTDAVSLLHRARESVADYVDGVSRREPEGR